MSHTGADRPHEGSPFTHQALVYRGAQQFARATAAFARDGLLDGELVVAFLSDDRSALLAAELAGLARQVQFVDVRRIGRNPGHAHALLRALALDRGDARPVRAICEPVWPGRSHDELAECHVHEALSNTSFDSARGFSLLCPYNAGELSLSVLSFARRTHPLVSRADSGGAAASSTYQGNGYARVLIARPLPKAPTHTERLPLAPATLPHVRKFTQERGTTAGLSADRSADLADAVTALSSHCVNGNERSGLCAPGPPRRIASSPR